MSEIDLKTRVETLAEAQRSFYAFTTNVFAKSFPNFIGGFYIENSCNYLSKYDRTMKIAARSHFKSTSLYDYVMFNIMFRGIKEDLDIRYFSYNETLAGWHIQQIKSLIEKNPYFKEIINLKPIAENIGAYTWDRKHIVRIRPVGIVSFSRGAKSDILLLDDILSDPANPIHPTIILKINQIFRSVILESLKPGGEIHIVGSPISLADLYFDPELQKEFHTTFSPGIIKNKDGNEVPVWPEFYTLEQLKSKLAIMGEKAFASEIMCLKKGTRIIVPKGIQTIENIKKGDKVLGSNNWTEVLETFQRKAKKLIRIKANTQWLELTPEHPIRVVDTLKKKVLASSKSYTVVPRGNYYRHKPSEKLKFRWKKAQDIEKGDLVLFPLLKQEKKEKVKKIDVSQYISVLCSPSSNFIKPIPSSKKWERQQELKKKYQSFKKEILINHSSLRLFGHYVSEGFSGFYPNTNNWKFGIASIKEDIRKEFAQEFKDVFGFFPTITSSEIVGTNSGVSSFFGNAFGHTAREKHFPPFIFSLTLKEFLIFFEAMIEGDGYFEPRGQNIIYSSSSECLMNQLFLILNSFGIKSTLSKRSTKSCFQLIISKNENEKLLKYFLYNKKGITIKKGKFYPQLSFLTNNYLLTRVRKVEKEIGSFSVYNLHTKDNTYVASQVLVHNCEPFYSTDSFFKKENLRKTIVNKQLRNIPLNTGLDTRNLVIAGLDIGRKKHKSALNIFEVKDGKAIHIHRKIMKGWRYFTAKPYDPLKPSQVEYCVPGKTRIDVLGGSKEIRKIQVGDKIKTHLGNFKRVLKIYKRRHWAPVCKLKTKYQTLYLTKNHRILSTAKDRKTGYYSAGKMWRLARSIKPGHLLHYPKNFKKPKLLYFFRPQKGYNGKRFKRQMLTIDIAWLLGIYTAEGSSTERRINFTFGAHELDLIKKTKELLIRYFGQAKEDKHHSWATNIYVNSVGLSKTFKKWFGSNAREKHVPSFILQASERYKASFLRGLIEGDGSVRNVVTFVSASKQLRNQFIQLCNDISISCYSISEGKNISPQGKNFYIYRCSIRKIDWNKVLTLADNEYKVITNEEVLLKKERLREFKHVYNLEVEDDNSYIANGFIVHNCKEAIKNFGIDKLYYDDTRGEFMGAADSEILTPHFIPIVFTHKGKVEMASSLEKIFGNSQIEIFDDEDLLNSLCSVTNDLQKIESVGEHADDWDSIGLAMIGFNQFILSGRQDKGIRAGSPSVFDKEKPPRGW